MITPSQVSVGTSIVKLVDVPSGPCSVVLTNSGTAAVAVGTSSTNTTATNGGVIPVNGTVTLNGYPGSKGITLYGIAAGGTNPVGIFISTAS